ncbi:50S ribosomal protein L32e [Candidatus Woesearchaeota archaeon]|nr:50S ribosomal protein L32e [Candidatus Woesearchaeota archaeon]
MNLLELRKQIKGKKPKFVRQDLKKKRVSKNWRRPRGIDSKLRLKLKGHAKKVSIGYGSPKKVKGLHKSGLKVVFVSSPADLDGINKEKEGAIIKGSVGLRKKVELVNKAKEKGIKILNLKDPDQFLKCVVELMKKKKEEKRKIAEKKEKKAKQLKEKAKKKEEKGELADKIKSEEERKEEEKMEKDKLLTKRT